METWQNWKRDFVYLCRNKYYLFVLSLTAVFSYGFLITHQTVGIDDTPYALYFEEGLNAIIGRWFLFVLNKVFHISDFSPFVTDLAGVLILMAAAAVWCTLLYSICRDRVPLWGYLFFSCIFLSCPLISEVYTYYLHNGISVGYLCVGVSLCFFRELTGIQGEKRNGMGETAGGKRRAGRSGNRRRIIGCEAGMAVFLWIALGCYESFMIVWLLGLLLVLLTERHAGLPCRTAAMLAAGALAAVGALLLRSLMINGSIAVFGLEGMRDGAVQRSAAEMLGWILKPGAAAEFAMAVKRFYVMYGVFAWAYYPIRIFVAAALVMIAAGIYGAFRRKSGWIALLTLGCFAVCFLLTVVEGKATLYRSAQFLPVVCGYGAFLAVWGVNGLKNVRGRKYAGRILAFVLCVVLWNQCADMNKWFYVDWLKYQDAVNVAERIALELEKNHDTSKPVVFTGTYRVNRNIIQDAYVSYGTDTFYRMKRLTDLVDEHLLEKFYRGEYGVWVAQTPALSVLDWGINAFESDEELVRFFAMHGYSITGNRDQELFQKAMEESAEFPHFPAEGSIADMGDYIIVHF